MPVSLRAWQARDVKTSTPVVVRAHKESILILRALCESALHYGASLPDDGFGGLTLMTGDARLMSGIILITVPTIQYGGYFPLTSLMNRSSGYTDNALRQNFFRAGHAHAGVIVILSLVCQMLADAAVLPDSLLWMVRLGVPLSAILISAGFFFSMLPPAATQPGSAVALIYTGAVILAISVVTLGIGLLRTPQGG